MMEFFGGWESRRLTGMSGLYIPGKGVQWSDIEKKNSIKPSAGWNSRPLYIGL